MNDRRRRTAAEVAFALISPHVAPVVPIVAGGYAMPLVAAIRRPLELFPTRTEQGALLEAMGQAQETGLPAVCVVITSPGVYGLMQALHDAYVNRVRVVLLSGETSQPGSSQAGDGVSGPSASRITAHLTAWSADAYADLPATLARAVSVATERRLPVHLNVPMYVASREVDE